MSCDYRELIEFSKKLEKLGKQENIDKFYEDCLKELAARFLRKVTQITPVALTQYEDVTDEDGNLVAYKRGKKKGQIKERVTHTGGTLKRSWQIKEVNKNGGNYSIIIENPTPYASYVNYGHRQTPGRFVKALGKQLKVGWVDGQFFLEVEYVARCLNDG